jgi:hypothetical protein
MSSLMRRFAPRRTIAAGLMPLMLLVSVAGCYSAVPMVPGAPPVTGQRVSLRLTAAGTARVEPVFGPFIVSLDGTRESAATDSVVVRVTRTHHQAGTDETRQGDVVRLAPSEIAQIEGRRLSKGRTALVLGVVLGALALIPVALGSSGGGGLTGGGTTPP